MANVEERYAVVLLRTIRAQADCPCEMNRLRTNSQQGHEATLAQLVSLQNLFTDAQAKLDHLTSLAVTEPAAANVDSPTIEESATLESSASVSPPVEDPIAVDVPRRRTIESIQSVDDAWSLAKEKIEEHETVAVGVAGALGGLVLAGVWNILTR